MRMHQYKRGIILNFLLVSLFAVISSCKTATPQSDSGLAASPSSEIPCPYGSGIDGSTGKYISCQCPASHPYYNQSSGMCSNAKPANVKCFEDTSRKAQSSRPVIQAIDLDVRVAGNRVTDITGSGILVQGQEKRTFEVTLQNAQQVAWATFAGGLGSYIVLGTGQIKFSNGTIYAVPSISISPDGGNVMIKTPGATDNFFAHGCEVRADLLQTLDKVAPGR